VWKKHIQAMKEKISDRLNILKILSYKRKWRVKETYLVTIIKLLIRSIMDYASFMTTFICPMAIETLKRFQTNALRIIYRVKGTDPVTNESLRKEANVSMIKTRMQSMVNRYFTKGIGYKNPLVLLMLENYKKWKNQKQWPESAAHEDDFILEIISETNPRLIKKEKYKTIIGSLDQAIWKEFENNEDVQNR
jgi:hypothetical protein